MTLTFRALIYLYAFDHRLPVPNGMAFDSLVRACRLDYSVQSLARIDVLLDALRKTNKVNEQTYLDDPAQQNLLYVLAFYVGEVIGRALGSPPSWYTWEQAAALFPSNQHGGPTFAAPVFENSAVLAFPDHAASSDKTFFPLVSLTQRLFTDHPGRSVHFSAGFLLPVAAQSGAAARLPLPAIPPPAWPADVAGILATHSATTFDMDRPPWASDDGLRPLFDAGRALMQHGRIVPGALIQAHDSLFQPGPIRGAPGEVVYDPAGRTPAADLVRIAAKIAALKGEPHDDPALAHIASYLGDGETRVFGLDVPHAIVPYPLKISTTWFDRQHLRGGIIEERVIPLLVSDAHPGLVRPLPEKFWPQAGAPVRAAQPAPPAAVPMPDALAHRNIPPVTNPQSGLMNWLRNRK